jgi:hypothetical protein
MFHTKQCTHISDPISTQKSLAECQRFVSYHMESYTHTHTHTHTRVYPKVSGLVTWSENWNWYSSVTRCTCIAILWISLVSFAALTLYVASQWVFIIVSVYFVIDSVRKLLDTPSDIWNGLHVFVLHSTEIPPNTISNLTYVTEIQNCTTNGEPW